MQRREFLLLSAGALLPVPVLGARDAIRVYKNAACGCCEAWIKHLRANGFEVQAHDVDDTVEHRRRHGVPDALGSCHTALLGEYVVEGHVPAREIKRLLREKPKAAGLAVPGMPIGSPGMEGPRIDPYDVLLFQRNGRFTTYARYGR